MRALRANITILLDPRVIGPDAIDNPSGDDPTWGGPHADAAACDFLSECLSSHLRETVLDWSYTEPTLSEGHWAEVEVGDPSKYEEGSHV